jgi:hypothetical protein
MVVTYAVRGSLASPRDRHNPALLPSFTNLCAPRDRYNRSGASDSGADSLKSRIATRARPA